MCSGRVALPLGCFSATSARVSSSIDLPLAAARASICRCTSGVSTHPGHTAFAVTPLPAVSSAVAFVRPTSPCLLATYAHLLTLATRPCELAMLTTRPKPRSTIAGRHAFVVWNAALRLSAMSWSHLSSGKSLSGLTCCMPACSRAVEESRVRGHSKGGRRDILRICRACAHIVDQDVDGAQPRLRLRDHRPNLLRLCEIGVDVTYLDAVALQLPDRRADRRRFAEAVDRHVAARSGERPGYFEADAGRRARDDRRPSRERPRWLRKRSHWLRTRRSLQVPRSSSSSERHRGPEASTEQHACSASRT
eukprot:2968571-Prymnesium_polylepis.2